MFSICVYALYRHEQEENIRQNVHNVNIGSLKAMSKVDNVHPYTTNTGSPTDNVDRMKTRYKIREDLNNDDHDDAEINSEQGKRYNWLNISILC